VACGVINVTRSHSQGGVALTGGAERAVTHQRMGGMIGRAMKALVPALICASVAAIFYGG
jgi:hypothetical protein